MISKLKYLISEYRFYFLSIVVLLALLIYSYNETLALEKELVRVNNELHVRQVTYGKRQKEYFKKVERQQAQLERMLKEIKSHGRTCN